MSLQPPTAITTQLNREKHTIKSPAKREMKSTETIRAINVIYHETAKKYHVMIFMQLPVNAYKERVIIVVRPN